MCLMDSAYIVFGTVYSYLDFSRQSLIFSFTLFFNLVGAHNENDPLFCKEIE